MGKRSSFKRNPRDLYKTCDPRAVKALLPHIKDVTVYAEVCAGDSDLVRLLMPYGKVPVVQYDIHPLNRYVERRDVFSLRPCDLRGASTIITNPPWDRAVLHPLIMHLMSLGVDVWLLFDAAWAHTIQSAPYMLYCRKTVAVGRLCWFPETKTQGKDDAQWYNFSPRNVGEPTIFYGRSEDAKGTLADNRTSARLRSIQPRACTRERSSSTNRKQSAIVQRQNHFAGQHKSERLPKSTALRK